MWYQKTPNNKIQFFEQYKDPLTGKSRTISMVLPNASPSNQKAAREALGERKKVLSQMPEAISTTTLKELKNAYIKWKYATLKEQTAISSEAKLNTIIKLLGEDTLVSRLTVRYITEKLDVPEASKYNERIKHLKAMLRWGFQNDYIANDTVANKLKARKQPSARERNAYKYLEHDEINILMDNFIPRWKLLTQFLILTGMRIGEAIDLKAKDVDLKERTINIHSTYSVIAEKSSSTKTETSERIIYIQDELKRCIQEIRKLVHKRSKYFFCNEDGSHVEYYAYCKYFKENTEKLLSRRLTPHCTRHTHTALLAEAGIPLEQISRRLGHADSKITRDVYMHITDKMKEKENERLKKLNLI